MVHGLYVRDWYLIREEGDWGEGDCGEADCGEADYGEGEWKSYETLESRRHATF